MHYKNIKFSIRKQLKNQYPHWHRLNRKTKKEIARKVLAEIITEYDFSCDITASQAGLFGIEQQVSAKGIIMDEMARFIERINQNSIIKLSSYKCSPLFIKDEELHYIDTLIDDRIINRLLSYSDYSPALGVSPGICFVLSC